MYITLSPQCLRYNDLCHTCFVYMCTRVLYARISFTALCMYMYLPMYIIMYTYGADYTFFSCLNRSFFLSKQKFLWKQTSLHNSHVCKTP